MPQWTATCLAVAIGGGLGAVAREATLTILAGATTHDVPPWLLLLPINLLGCFAMGFTLMVIELRFHPRADHCSAGFHMPPIFMMRKAFSH